MRAKTLLSSFASLLLAPALALAAPAGLPADAAAPESLLAAVSAPDDALDSAEPAVRWTDADAAEPTLMAGYFSGTRPRESPVPVVAGPRLIVRPMQVGVLMTLGSHIPIAGNTHTYDGRREFTGTFDLGGALFFNVQRLMQFDLVARGGFGGVSTDLYEERYRIPGLESRHLWIGSTFRVFPIDFFGIQPYASASIGGDRVLAVRREPNGSYECTTDGWVTTCDPELERVFAAGYWGTSVGYGGGLRIEPGRNGHFSIFIDVQHLFQRYGRRTSTQTGRQLLGAAAPRTQVITANVGVALGF